MSCLVLILSLLTRVFLEIKLCALSWRTVRASRVSLATHLPRCERRIQVQRAERRCPVLPWLLVGAAAVRVWVEVRTGPPAKLRETDREERRCSARSQVMQERVHWKKCPFLPVMGVLLSFCRCVKLSGRTMCTNNTASALSRFIYLGQLISKSSDDFCRWIFFAVWKKEELN